MESASLGKIMCTMLFTVENFMLRCCRTLKHFLQEHGSHPDGTKRADTAMRLFVRAWKFYVTIEYANLQSGMLFGEKN
jgi:hypothetical protein